MKSRLILLATVLATASLSGCGGSGSKINVDIPGGGTVRNLQEDEEAMADFESFVMGATLPNFDADFLNPVTINTAIEVPNVSANITNEIEPGTIVNGSLNVKDLALEAIVSAESVNAEKENLRRTAAKGKGSGKIDAELKKNDKQLLTANASLSGVEFFYGVNEYDDAFVDVSSGAAISLNVALPGLANGSLSLNLTDAIKIVTIAERDEAEEISTENSLELTSEESLSSSSGEETPQTPESMPLPEMITGILSLLAIEFPSVLTYKTYDDGGKALKVTVDKDSLISIFNEITGGEEEPEVENSELSAVSEESLVSSSESPVQEGDINLFGMPIFINKCNISIALAADSDLRLTSLAFSAELDASTKRTHEYVVPESSEEIISSSEESSSLGESSDSISSKEPEIVELDSSANVSLNAKASFGLKYGVAELSIPESPEGYEIVGKDGPAFISDITEAFNGVFKAILM